MKTVLHRAACGGLALALLPAYAGATAIGDVVPASNLVAALLWLATLGGGFCLFLRGRLKTEDSLHELRIQLALEHKARVLAEQALADTHGVLCKLVRQQDTVRDSERGRIARDIHDDLGQNLLALRIDLSLLQVATNGIHAAIHQKVGGMIINLDLAIRSLRGVINDLRPLALEEGLRPAMVRQLSEFSRLNGIPYQFEVAPGACEAVPRDSGLDAMLYRVLQEALSNVARHARASEVRVVLGRRGDRLTMRVHDNGVGLPAGLACSGCGLAGMRQRVGALGGALAIENQPAGGTVLSLSAPLPFQRESDFLLQINKHRSAE
jgi:signal transduction histidine kinase